MVFKIIILLCCILVTSLGSEKKQFYFEEIDGMCHGKNATMQARLRIISQDQKYVYLNGTLRVAQDVLEPTQVTIRIYKCRSKDNPDSCELFLNTSPSDYCVMISGKTPDVSPFHIEYVPSVRCPIKKGTYHAINTKVDPTPAKMFPLDDAHWRVITEVTGVRSKKMVFCIKIEGAARRT